MRKEFLKFICVLLFLSCGFVHPSAIQLAPTDTLSFTSGEFGLKTNFTFHEELMDSLGTEGLLLINITGTKAGDVLIDNYVFEFEQTLDVIDYGLIFAFPELVPQPDGTILQVFSAENLDNAIDTIDVQATENFLYYIIE